MRRQPNSRHCFVCGVENRAGVRTSFFDTEGEDGRIEVLARFVASDEHQGYPGRLHGGVATGILDEVIGRAINAANADGDSTIWGVAVELAIRFLQPVPLGVELSARGWITRERGRLFEGAGEILLPDGRVAATASGRYLKLALDRISQGIDPEELGWRVVEDPDES